jgi:hypothetical protein
MDSETQDSFVVENAGLGPYSYHPLRPGDIRILDIQPGKLTDPIRFKVVHIPLATGSKPDTRLSRSHLQATLPKGWEVFETPEGRYLFWHGSDDDDDGEDNEDEDEEDGEDDQDVEPATTWRHEEPSFDRAAYELPPDEDFWAREPCFEALSYVWGPQDNPEQAIVEADDEDTAIASMPLGPNLAAALHHLRYETSVRRLWVDAICINQKDDAEKAVQVSRMNDLYTLTTRVVVWLGEEEDDSALAVSTMAHLGAQVETTLDGFRMVSPDAEETEWYDIDVALPFDKRTWDAIVELVSRPWFGRVWTAQEILLANRLAVLQCGHATITWALFRRALECILDKDTVPRGRDVLSLARSAVVNGADRPLHRIITRHGHRQCFDPHDKVYGMLGMAPPAFRAVLVPNYKQPYAETYRDAFLVNTGAIKRWELFGCDTADRTIEAPSWVPDLVPQSSHTFDSSGQLSSGISELHMTYHEPNQLDVVGLRFATVETVGDRAPNASVGLIRTVRSWVTDDFAKARYPGKAPIKDEYAIMLAQGCLRERCPTEEGWPKLSEWKRYCQNKVFSKETPSSFSRSNTLDDLLFKCCEGRVFMRTQDGHIGLGPYGSQKGQQHLPAHSTIN